MAKYAVANPSTGATAVAAAYKTLLSVNASTGATPRRGKIYDLLVGTDGTPADNFMTWDVSRITSTVAGAVSFTPNALDPADAAADSQAFTNHTAEATITSSSSLFVVGVNQRASYRWVAAPGGELLWPATTANGLVVRVLSGGYTGTATATVHFEEL